MQEKEDKTIDHLLELDGVRYVIDELLGLWVKFEVKQIQMSKERPQGIKYSLTLHDSHNNRIMGFDNSHSIMTIKEKNGCLPVQYDHWHRGMSDRGRLYRHESAAKLLGDFWVEVDKIINRLSEIKK